MSLAWRTKTATCPSLGKVRILTCGSLRTRVVRNGNRGIGIGFAMPDLHRDRGLQRNDFPVAVGELQIEKRTAWPLAQGVAKHVQEMSPDTRIGHNFAVGL